MISSAPLYEPGSAELIAARPFLSVGPDGLCLEGVALEQIAQALGTPCWVYGADTMRKRTRRLFSALRGAGLNTKVHFAVKANSNLAVLRQFATEGAGADVVSGGELLRARRAGVPAGGIVFSGVGKSIAELELALTEDIAQINAESAEELDMISATAARLGRQARVALRINPDVDAGTHAKITTGKAENKFGIPFTDAVALYARAATLPGLQPVGIATHIGSQIGDVTPYRAAYRRMAELVVALRQQQQTVQVVDCGGGLGIDYSGEDEASPDAFAAIMAETLGDLEVELAIEPGRWLVGPAGLLLSRVVLTKGQHGQRFMVLDAAMNDLARPAMYEAWHGIVPLRDPGTPSVAQDIVGPVCETGDCFAKARALPELAPGAVVALLDAGAYGATMSSNYNSRPLAAEVMVDGASGRWTTIRARQKMDALWQDEILPDWLHA